VKLPASTESGKSVSSRQPLSSAAQQLLGGGVVDDRAQSGQKPVIVCQQIPVAQPVGSRK
jgi:hypothetical protein